MSNTSDLVHVIDRTAFIENLLNQVIEEFFEPRKDPFMFFWNVVLDNSIMPMGSKAKVVTAIAQELDVKLAQQPIHAVMSLRNAFAHHKTDSHPVFVAARTPGESKRYYQLQVLSNSGKLTWKRREDALAKFDEAYSMAKDSLIALLDVIKAKRAAYPGSEPDLH